MNSNIKKKIETNQYKQSLNETYTKIIKQLKHANSEATVAGIFENNLYSFIDNFFGKQINFQKEVGQNYLRHTFTGKIDAISNNCLIEYKNKTKLDSEKDQLTALEQIKNYLMQIYKETNEALSGILTNGAKISYVYFFDEELKHTKFSAFSVRALDRIVKSLIVVGTKRYSPTNIVEDFKIDSSSNLLRNLLQALYKTYNEDKTSKTEMLFEEWQVLFRLSDSDQGKNRDIIKRKESLSKIFNQIIEKWLSNDPLPDECMIFGGSKR